MRGVGIAAAALALAACTPRPHEYGTTRMLDCGPGEMIVGNSCAPSFIGYLPGAGWAECPAC